MINFTRSFDSIFNSLRQSHFNKRGVYPGVLVSTIYSGVALCAWGLYNAVTIVSKQITADTSTSSMIEVHAKVVGLTKEENETTEQLLERYTTFVQSARHGWDKAGWERRAESISYNHGTGGLYEGVEKVATAEAFENARGDGTINIVISSDNAYAGLEEIASTQLVAAVKSGFDDTHPLGLWDYLVIAAERKDVDIDVEIEADDWDLVSELFNQQLVAAMKKRGAGKPFNLIEISGIAYQCGATNVVINSPVSNITVQAGPMVYERVWPNTITIGVL